MSEIKIEKKTPIWPWVILGLIILAVVAYLLLNNDEDDTYDDDNTETIDETDDYRNNTSNDYDTNRDVEYNNAMIEFNSYVRDSSRIGTDSTYTKTAFHKLANMTVMKADQNNLDDSESLKNLRGYAMQTNGTANDIEVRKNLKRMGKDVANVIESIQDKNYPNLDSNVNSMKDKLNKLNDTDAFDKQQQNIRHFIVTSKDILNSMNR